ncbi:type VII secretion target [Actinoplanes sp. URMC 104]|uniref:type VII secretion target n=1 Tax=Actinoplanes sp. URMC 104 TaxID=3423409 RepID=UPI003F192C10
MSFKAEPERVQAFASTITDLVDDADRAVNYSRNYLGIGYNEGRMFATVVETATAVREALLTNYQALAKLADQSGQELDRAARDYHATDQDAARRIDATY